MTIYNNSLHIENDSFVLDIRNYEKIKQVAKDWPEIKQAVQDYIVLMGGSEALKERVKEIEEGKK